MSFKAFLYNGGSTPIELTPRNGLVYKDEYNETRDSATIVVRSKQHIDVQPFDYAVIQGSVRGNSITDKNLLVDSASEEQTSFGDEPSYDTTITLFSETKEMERVTLPNLSITSKKDGTANSVYHYIEEYLSHFAPRIKVRNGNSYTFEVKWEIAPRVRTRFSAIQCPEFSWNRPTLCEVITDLMLVDDCIPVIKEHILSFINLSARGEEADDSNFVRVVRGIASQDYNQNLDVNMQNAISTKPAHMVEYISMRNESSAILTTDNMQIITQKPIYEIKKITAVYLHERTSSNNQTRYFSFDEVDITRSVKEKMAYDVLNPTPADFSSPSDFRSKQQTHQVANVWFTRGGRAIEGFGKVFQFYNRSEIALRYILRGYLDVNEVTDAFDSVDWRDVMFKVEYMSQSEISIKAGRKLPLRNPHTSSFDNQPSSYVDVRQQSLFEYAKANRLANRIVEINGTCFKDADVPALGQTFKGAVIFSREIQYMDDAILFHLFATDNYVLANYFTSVRARRRSWAIASGKEALTRHENIKMYAEFSRAYHSDSTVNPISSIYFDEPPELKPEKVLSALFHFFNDETVKTAALCTIDANNARLPKPESAGQNPYFITDCQTSATGFSVSLSVELQDNYSIGERVTIDSNGRYINNIIPYADADGEFASFSIEFLSYCDPADGDFVWGGYYSSNGQSIIKGYPEYTDNTSPNEFKEQRIAKARKKPISASIATSESQLHAESILKKDNREIFAITAQIEYCAEDAGIVIKEALADKCYLVHGEQESYSGLPRLASEEVKTPSTLPAAASAYRYAGFLYRDASMFGDSALRIATSVLNGSTNSWSFSSIAAGQKFAVMDGYEESQSEPYPETRGIFSRIIIVKADEGAANVSRFERDFKIFTMERPLKETEDDVPSGATIIADNSPVEISQVLPKCIRVYYQAGASSLCWGLCDSSNRVIFAVNSLDGETNAGAVFVNLSSTRDHRVRQSVQGQHIVVREV